MANTIEQYDYQAAKCRDLFVKKTHDYGTSWRVMRTSSLIDQIFIKAQRIRSIEEKQEQKIGDTIESEYLGIVNYSIIALIQMDLGESVDELDMDYEKIFESYDKKAGEAMSLMLMKNHDYGEAWREMSMTSLTDMVLSKITRIRHIMANKGITIASEGIDSNLFDMINYGLFAMIRLSEVAKQSV